jgi:hypothetical protein
MFSNVLGRAVTLPRRLENSNLERRLQSLLKHGFKSGVETASYLSTNVLDDVHLKTLKLTPCSSVTFTQQLSYYAQEYHGDLQSTKDNNTYHELYFNLTLLANFSSTNASLPDAYPITQMSNVFAIRYNPHTSLPTDTAPYKICYAPPHAYLKNPNASQWYTLKELEMLRSPLNWSSIINDTQVCFHEHPVGYEDFPQRPDGNHL